MFINYTHADHHKGRQSECTPLRGCLPNARIFWRMIRIRPLNLKHACSLSNGRVRLALVNSCFEFLFALCATCTDALRSTRLISRSGPLSGTLDPFWYSLNRFVPASHQPLYIDSLELPGTFNERRNRPIVRRLCVASSSFDFTPVKSFRNI